ncbi:MAG TPA: VIT and VWA domain-containing protein, partial [Opitutales bacterium]|nr:VIT and VWA domain-containing protein [Opitutales bacterium]
MNLPSRLNFHRAALLALATVAAFTTAAAQPPAGSGLPGIPTTPSRPGFAPGQLSILDSKGNPIGVCPLEHTDVQANLAGFVGRVHVKQEFRNLAKDPVEAVYTFPLPDNAAVDDLKMRIGDRLITADIKKREDARQIYDAARAAGQNAALLDQERANVFTQSVANIMPGQAITIEISFEQPIKYDSGYYEWTFPTVVGPRFTGGESGGPNPDKVTPPVIPEGLRAGHDISITVNIEAGMPLREVKSELHAIDLQQPTRTSAVVKLRDAATIPNRDFILRYATAGDQVQSGVIALAPQNGDTGYFTLILQPPAAPPAADIAPKEMIFVIDQTGSQAGLPFQKARETINYCLQHLNPNDTFQLIGFNTEVFPCTPEPVPVTPENVAQAQAWLAALDARGGTNVYKAIDYVLSQPGDAKRPRIVAVMTDGYIGNDTAIIQMIAEHRSLSRIFPFGIGNAVNRYLIDGMAREGRGAADYVDLNADSKEIAEKFYQRISQPLLLDVAVDWGALPVSEVLPSHIPDVFSAAPITVTGRYAHGGQGIIKVSGLLRGQPWSQEIAVTLPDGPSANTEALRTIWAREKIADLEIESWKADMLARQAAPNARYTPNNDLKDKVTALALQYRLMS